MKKAYIPCCHAAVISLVSFAVYLSALRNDFVIWDDNVFILNNYHIRSLDWSFFRWAFSDISSDFWRPVTLISQAVDYAVWGLNPLGHHLTSILLHAANTFIVVYLVIGLMEAADSAGMQAGRPPTLRWRSVLITADVTGLLFGLHPIHVETVAWVSERADLLYSIFYLLGITAYVSHVSAGMRKACSVESRLSIRDMRYFLSLMLFVFALSSKPVAVTLPAVLLLLDWYPLGRILSFRNFIARIVEKLPFIGLSLFFSILTFITQQAIGTVASIAEVSKTTRSLVAFKAIMIYLWQMIAPINLTPFHPYPENVSFLSIGYIAGMVSVIGITVVFGFTARRGKILLAAWIFYLATLLPVLGIVKVREVYLADRYTYLPSLGIFLIAGVLSAKIWDTVLARRNRRAAVIVAVFAVVVISIMTQQTLKQIAIWKDTITLWTHVIEKQPGRVPAAYANRGMAFKEKGQFDRALADYNMAVTLAPDDSVAYIGRGLVYKELGQIENAQKDNTTAIALAPASPVAYTNRGIVFAETGNIDSALEDFRAAIALAPDYVDAYIGSGLAFIEKGRIDLAVEALNTAIRLNPYGDDAYINRGVAFERMGQFERAVIDYGKAIELRPDDPLPFLNRGKSLGKLGRFDEAVRDFKRACVLGSQPGCDALRTDLKQPN